MSHMLYLLSTTVLILAFGFSSLNLDRLNKQTKT
jgi:hypothetical protein